MALTDDVMFVAGVRYEQTRIVKLLEEEQKRTGLGFIQYQRILEILGESKEAS
jgi:hypothetical protein